jgi:murein DD-endopeptidase MepM/ murein hydrolase activator NlpD
MTNMMIRAALVAAAATLATACAATPQYATGRAPAGSPPALRPAYPAPSADADSDPMPEGMPSTPVESAQLPAAAPSASSAAVETSSLPPVAAPDPYPEPRYEAPPEPVMVPVTKTVTLAPGKLVDVDGRPKTYTVKEGQGLDAVARAMGSSRAELAKINDLKEPYRLKPGQVLKGPASRAKAYVVASGDTLIAIGRRFGVTVAALAEENDITSTSAIRVGQKIKLPMGYKDAGPQTRTITVMEPAPVQPAPRPQLPAPRPQPVAPPPAPRPQAAAPPPAAVTSPPAPRPVPPRPTPAPAPTPTPTPTRPVVTPPPAVVRPPVVRPPVATPAPTPPRPSATAPLLPDDRPPTLTDADITALGRGRFEWPVRGEVISDFGPKGGGRRNDGLDIAAPAGTPVRAAAAGKVVYSGGDVPGFGVTVLIQHEDGWVTVYGNLQTASVRMQQVVRAGEQIGAVGASGGAPRPQLHFEVRYSPSPKFKAKAIDPALVLPR